MKVVKATTHNKTKEQIGGRVPPPFLCFSVNVVANENELIFHPVWSRQFRNTSLTKLSKNLVLYVLGSVELGGAVVSKRSLCSCCPTSYGPRSCVPTGYGQTSCGPTEKSGPQFVLQFLVER